MTGGNKDDLKTVALVGDCQGVSAPRRSDPDWHAASLHRRHLSAHLTPKVEAFLDDHPRIFLHNTPTHASWLNQVELFFSILERRLLRNGEFDSVEQLARLGDVAVPPKLRPAELGVSLAEEGVAPSLVSTSLSSQDGAEPSRPHQQRLPTMRSL